MSIMPTSHSRPAYLKVTKQELLLGELVFGVVQQLVGCECEEQDETLQDGVYWLLKADALPTWCAGRTLRRSGTGR